MTREPPGGGAAGDACDKSRIPSVYPGLLSLLRFFRESGRLDMLDKLAWMHDVQQGLRLIEEMASLASRLTPVSLPGEQGDYCLVDSGVGEDDARWYRRLGARVERRGGVYDVYARCPGLPSRDELSRLAECVSRGRLTFYDLVLFALAR